MARRSRAVSNHPLSTRDRLLIGGFAAWLVATSLSQHPHRALDRVRTWPRGLIRIPDWRFFAPEPGRTDTYVLMRIVMADGTSLEWTETHEYPGRSWSHALYYPKHRLEKGFFDLVSGLRLKMSQLEGPLEEISEYPVLVSHVRTVLRQSVIPPGAVGFQFMVVEDGGYDEDADIEVRLLSRLEPLDRDD